MLLAMLSYALVTAAALMLVFPRTLAGRAIRRVLVEAPAKFLLDFSWAKVGKVVLSAAALLFMMAMGPQMLLLMVSMGLDAAFVEVLILAYLASAAGGVAAAWRSVRRMPARLLRIAHNVLRPGRSRSARRPKPPRPGRRKDDPEPGWAFA